ncbi:hypothetical protein [Halorussus halobius]|uniref:hypothetical protein n=1 Tax=Halorussus halobius TaxID=1710537 RepID=UPI00143DE733|nr:hypothetical protein [Halorussus halobius]
MRGRQDERLPERFDERVTLEIDDDAEGRPTVRLQDESATDAWIAADIRALVSLPERE